MNREKYAKEFLKKYKRDPNNTVTFRSVPLSQFTKRELIKIIELTEERYPVDVESCIDMGMYSNVIPMECEIESCLTNEPPRSCLTELPEYPGEKIKWQRSKTLLRICLYYIKKMLLATRLFYDNSQKNSE